MSESTDFLPPIIQAIAREHPEVWEAYERLGRATEGAGPLDPKQIRLIKLALAIGAGRQGSVRSHARRALKAGWSPEEVRQVALLAITTTGWSSAIAGLSWIDEAIAPKERGEGAGPA